MAASPKVPTVGEISRIGLVVISPYHEMNRKLTEHMNLKRHEYIDHHLY